MEGLAQIFVGAGALDSPLEGVIKSSCRKHYVDNTNEIADEMSEGRDVGGAVPYMVCENINVVGGNTHC